MNGDQRKKKLDDFWDIRKLVPQKRASLSRFSTAQPLSDVEVPPRESEPKKTHCEGRLTFPEMTPDEVSEESYQPADNPLLLSVSVRRTAGGYSFYERFLRDARALFEVPGIPAEYVPFFSFTPQYTQLSEAQRAYYFYLRSEVRADRYPRADKGYFFLLVYEIISLPDLIHPPEGARLLASLWAAYRRSLPEIDRYMIPWLADYCLLHAVPCPPEVTPECLSAAAECDEIEFYFGNASAQTPEGVLRLLSLSSEYHFESSRAFTVERQAVFRRHLTGAMSRVFLHLAATGLLATSSRPEVARRRAFSGSLCSHNVRAEITVEYISLRRGEGLRRIVTLAVKHAENRLRSALGIRARLSATGLPADIAAVVDRYFDSVAAGLAPPRPAPPPPAYEHLYEAPDRGMDPAAAAAIEEASWGLTRRLVADSCEEPEADAPTLAQPEPSGPPTDGAQSGLLDPLASAVSAFLSGQAAVAHLARVTATPAALLAERVNEGFLAAYGDVLLEASEDGGFVLIEEYREDAIQWLKTI